MFFFLVHNCHRDRNVPVCEFNFKSIRVQGYMQPGVKSSSSHWKGLIGDEEGMCS